MRDGNLVCSGRLVRDGILLSRDRDGVIDILCYRTFVRDGKLAR